MVELRKITWENFSECLALDVTENQQNFIDNNVYALAQAYVAATNDKFPPIAYAIYNDQTVVGIVILVHKYAKDSKFYHENCYEVVSFMIGRQYQGKGYGKEAFARVIDVIKTFPEGKAKAICLSYDPQNDTARRLYASYGFTETGTINDIGEVVAKLQINK
jgi:diamine N-acetyltransferase